MHLLPFTLGLVLLLSLAGVNATQTCCIFRWVERPPFTETGYYDSNYRAAEGFINELGDGDNLLVGPGNGDWAWTTRFHKADDGKTTGIFRIVDSPLPDFTDRGSYCVGRLVQVFCSPWSAGLC